MRFSVGFVFLTTAVNIIFDASHIFDEVSGRSTAFFQGLGASGVLRVSGRQ